MNEIREKFKKIKDESEQRKLEIERANRKSRGAFLKKDPNRKKKTLTWNSKLNPEHEQFIQNEEKIWWIDWEYAGFNTPLFDLGGLASNNDFNENEEKHLLESYFEKKLSSELLIKYKAIKSASLLRETMWSMVSEITSNIEFDYKSYTAENLSKFNESFDEEFKIN